MVGIPTQLPLFLAHLAQKPKEQEGGPEKIEWDLNN